MVMGVDYHHGFQQIAFLMEETGEYRERGLNHRDGEAERVAIQNLNATIPPLVRTSLGQGKARKS